MVTGYEKLCDDLRAMIGLNNTELARLRAELADLKARFDSERESWSKEREALVERIAELEALNLRLERQYNQLRAEARGRM